MLYTHVWACRDTEPGPHTLLQSDMRLVIIQRTSVCPRAELKDESLVERLARTPEDQRRSFTTTGTSFAYRHSQVGHLHCLHLHTLT